MLQNVHAPPKMEVNKNKTQADGNCSACLFTLPKKFPRAHKLEKRLDGNGQRESAIDAVPQGLGTLS